MRLQLSWPAAVSFEGVLGLVVPIPTVAPQSLDVSSQSCLSVLMIRLPAFPSDSREQGGGHKVFNGRWKSQAVTSAVLVLQVHLCGGEDYLKGEYQRQGSLRATSPVLC